MTKMLKRVLQDVLSEEENEQLISAFDQIGDIIIVRIPDSLISKKQIIGKTLLEQVSTANSVFYQSSPVEGDFRTRQLEVIAGVEKPNTGSIDKKIKISYKPQYLTNDIDVEVISVLEKANGTTIEGSAEEEQILDPLKLKKLYNKSVKNLSGGELQKVAIASCLLQKVDLYALDEPSAFLDVEDRIAVAKFLQKFVRSFGKSAIIIDHDLQLMDLVSDSMVIFEGTSSVEGIATSPMPKTDAMNRFLESLDISFRKDEKTSRHRVNKEASRLDKEQKSSGNYYFRK